MNVSNEGLGNTIHMFNDSIKVHHNVDNTLNFTFTDRDRRSINLDNKLIKVLIIDDDPNIIVHTFYLSPTNNPKIYTATIPASVINNLLPRRGYNFMVVLESADGSTTPLYINHEFDTTAELTVVNNYLEVGEELIVGEYIQRTTTKDRQVDGEYVFSKYIDVDNHFFGLMARTLDDQTMPTLNVKIQKCRGKYFPIDVSDEIQWEDYIEFKNSHDYVIERGLLSEGKYRLVVISQDPGNYIFIEKRIHDR